MWRPLPIVDSMRDVVKAAAPEVIGQISDKMPDIKSIYYAHGHPVEIINALIEQDRDPEKKFDKWPLVMLFQDFPEEIPSRIPGCYSDVTLHMVIAVDTKAEYTAKQRYEETFRPILYPLYDEILNQIDQHPAFRTDGVEKIKHLKFDRLFWGKEGLYGTSSNTFNDRIDAIEIRNLQLTTNYSRCKPVIPAGEIFDDVFADQFA